MAKINILIKFQIIIIILMICLSNLCYSHKTLDINNNKTLHCCNANNVLTKKCINIETGEKSNVSLQCAEGQYLIDPSSYDVDEFVIRDDGHLYFLNYESLVNAGSYCLANYTNYENETEGTITIVKDIKDTHLVALACFQLEDSEDSFNVILFKGTIGFISVFFILLTLYVYYIIPDLRETQDKVTCIALMCLAIFFFFLGLVQVNVQVYFTDLCVPFAYIVYFFSISYFAWLNVIMANVWKLTVLRKWKIPERKWYTINHIYGWSIGIILFIIASVTHHLDTKINPNFGVKSCWFAEVEETWIFMYIPVSIMLLINIVLFVWTSISLHRQGEDISPDRRKALKYKTCLYFRLFLLAGLTWIFEILSFYYESRALNSLNWIFTDVLNALHGVFIFFVLVVWRQRIRRELGGKKICCISAPQSWSQIPDLEQEQLNDDEDTVNYDLIIK